MKYTEILKLKRLLEEANIPFEFTDDFFGVKERAKFSAEFAQKYNIKLEDEE